MSVTICANRAEWQNERQKGIGASDAAAVLGLSKWKSNVELWEEKVGLRQSEDISDKPYVKYGNDAEPHIRALFALDHTELRVTYESPFKIIRNDAHPFIFATPDGELEEIATGRRGGLEIKTTEIMHPRQWADWDERVPEQYYLQVIHQFIATDWDFIWLRANIKWTTKSGQKRIDTRDYLIERDDPGVPQDMAELKNGLILFWRCVTAKTRPALKLPNI